MIILTDRERKKHLITRCKALCPKPVPAINLPAVGEVYKCPHGRWFVFHERLVHRTQGYPRKQLVSRWELATFLEKRRIDRALRERPVSDRLWPDGEAITTTHQTAEQFVLSDDD